MALSVPLEPARDACLSSIDGFLAAVDGLDEYALLAASRCHGWTRLDVLVHVLTGWQEMLAGLVGQVDAEPTVDAVSYWPAFAAQFPNADPIPTLMAQRRRTAVYSRPALARDHLHDVSDGLRRGVAGFPDRPCTWQGHVFTPGDFLAIWAVEDVVHQLDLLTQQPAPPAALSLARATVEALVGAALPVAYGDLDVVLIGTGRQPVPAALGPLADRLPAFG